MDHQDQVRQMQSNFRTIMTVRHCTEKLFLSTFTINLLTQVNVILCTLITTYFQKFTTLIVQLIHYIH